MTSLSHFVRVACRIPRRLIVIIVRGYQITISPLIGPTCRFTPSCSTYCIESVKKYGAVRGCWRGMRRICAVIRSTRADMIPPSEIPRAGCRDSP